jgi:hypothetical protein
LTRDKPRHGDGGAWPGYGRITARFYDLPIQALLAGIGTPRKPVELAEVDLGISGASLRPVATVLGVDGEQLAGHTIAAAYP